MALTPVFSRHYAKLLLELLTRKNTTATAAQPAAVWLAILKTEPSGASTGSTIVEAAWTGYKRVKTQEAAWNAATEGATCQITNASLIEIPYVSGEDTVHWAALCDAETAGNVIVIGELNAAFTVNLLDSPLKFEAGELKFQIPSS